MKQNEVISHLIAAETKLTDAWMELSQIKGDSKDDEIKKFLNEINDLELRIGYHYRELLEKDRQ